MNYAKLNTQNEVLEYPRSLDYFVKAGLITSTELTAEELLAASIVPVNPVSAPAEDTWYLKDLQAVKQPDGSWREIWVNLETTEEHKANETARKTQQVLRDRTYLLSITDWTQMPDVTLANKQAWADYRQALRDITDQPGFPWTLTWPSRPE